jgi:hypothetical protein
MTRPGRLRPGKEQLTGQRSWEAVLLRVYAHCIGGQADAANKRVINALGTQYSQPESKLSDEGDQDSARTSWRARPEEKKMSGRSAYPLLPVPSVAFLALVRRPEVGVHGRIADGGGP